MQHDGTLDCMNVACLVTLIKLWKRSLQPPVTAAAALVNSSFDLCLLEPGSWGYLGLHPFGLPHPPVSVTPLILQ